MEKKKNPVIRVDVFTDIQGKGNPAGVVLDGDSYTEEEMQQIAYEAGFNETVFVCSSQIADWRFRFFMPLKETPLCGHGTMGAVFVLCHNRGSQGVRIETEVGVLDVSYQDKTRKIEMTQTKPLFQEFTGEIDDLCKLVKIKKEDVDGDLPIKYAHTGAWTLLLPIKSAAALDKMIPDTISFPDVLKEIPIASIHPFVVVSKEDKLYSARHFSSPTSGSVEDSVTGTASGALGAYLNEYMYQEETLELTMYQGKHVGREGKVTVFISGKEVKISGTACLNTL